MYHVEGRPSYYKESLLCTRCATYTIPNLLHAFDGCCCKSNRAHFLSDTCRSVRPGQAPSCQNRAHARKVTSGCMIHVLKCNAFIFYQNKHSKSCIIPAEHIIPVLTTLLPETVPSEIALCIGHKQLQVFVQGLDYLSE